MVPVLAFRKGEPLFTLGAPGGRKIVSVIPQVISNMVDAGDAPQAAMEAPRLHTEGGELLVDDRVGEAAAGRAPQAQAPRDAQALLRRATSSSRGPSPSASRRRASRPGWIATSDASAAGV